MTEEWFQLLDSSYAQVWDLRELPDNPDHWSLFFLDQDSWAVTARFILRENAAWCGFRAVERFHTCCLLPGHSSLHLAQTKESQHNVGDLLVWRLERTPPEVSEWTAIA